MTVPVLRRPSAGSNTSRAVPDAVALPTIGVATDCEPAPCATALSSDGHLRAGRPAKRLRNCAARVRRCRRAAGSASPARSPTTSRAFERIGHQVVDLDARIANAVDERRVGAVLEQPANEVRQEVTMAADRRVDAAGDMRAAAARKHAAVERFAHPVQPLEFEVAHIERGGARARPRRSYARCASRTSDRHRRRLRAARVRTRGTRHPCAPCA